MNLVDAKCTSCGAGLKLDEKLERAYCQYCGNELIVEQAISKIKIDRSDEFDNLLILARDELKSKNYEEVNIICKKLREINPNNYVVWMIILSSILESSRDQLYLLKNDPQSLILLTLDDARHQELKIKLLNMGYKKLKDVSIDEIKESFVSLQYLVGKMDEINLTLQKAYNSIKDTEEEQELTKLAVDIFESLISFPMVFKEDIIVEDPQTYPEKWIVLDYLTNWMKIINQRESFKHENVSKVLDEMCSRLIIEANDIMIINTRNYYKVLLKEVNTQIGSKYYIQPLTVEDENHYKAGTIDILENREASKKEDSSPYLKNLTETVFLAAEEFRVQLIEPEKIDFERKAFETRLILDWDIKNKDYVKISVSNLNEDEFYEEDVDLDLVTPLEIPLSVSKKDLVRTGRYYNFSVTVTLSYFQLDDGEYDEIDYKELILDFSYEDGQNNTSNLESQVNDVTNRTLTRSIEDEDTIEQSKLVQNFIIERDFDSASNLIDKNSNLNNHKDFNLWQLQIKYRIISLNEIIEKTKSISEKIDLVQDSNLEKIDLSNHSSFKIFLNSIKKEVYDQKAKIRFEKTLKRKRLFKKSFIIIFLIIFLISLQPLSRFIYSNLPVNISLNFDDSIHNLTELTNSDLPYLTPSPSKDGHTFLGWYTNELFEGDKIEVIEPGWFIDIDLYPKFTRNSYNFVFKDYDGRELDSSEILFGDSLEERAPIPNRVGYTFIGWDIDVPKSAPSRNMIFNAIYEVNSYEVTFISQDTIISVKNFDYKQEIDFPLVARRGYTFDGWFQNRELNFRSPFVMPSRNLVLYSKFTINTYTINVYDNQNNLLISFDFEFGEILEESMIIPPAPAGYDFNSFSESIPGLMPSSNLSLFANFLPITYEIFYELNGGANHISNPKEFTVITPDIHFLEPSREGYDFGGWFTDKEFQGENITSLLSGSIGDLELHAKWIPAQYLLVSNVFESAVSVILGGGHSSAITYDGGLVTWGLNLNGQLGDGTRDSSLYPLNITSQFDLALGEKISMSSLGGSHSAALTSEGKVFTWGSNNRGQLGDGTSTQRMSPVNITERFNLNENESIMMISLGASHSAALTSLGRVYTWGSNVNGRLGDGTTIHRNTPIDITSNFELEIDEKIIMISLGGYHSSALSSKGRLFTWGLNASGILGDGTTNQAMMPINITRHFELDDNDRLISVVLGSTHSSAISSEGNLFIWGANGDLGSLGIGSSEFFLSVPENITTNLDLLPGERILSISMGGSHSAALTSAGRVFTWGSNSQGSVGDGTTINRLSPINITDQFDLLLGEEIIAISLGGSHSSALSSNQRIFVWGSNGSGRLGNGSTLLETTPQDITLNLPFVQTYFSVAFATPIQLTPMLRPGFIFSGWFMDETLTIPLDTEIMPSENFMIYGRYLSE